MGRLSSSQLPATLAAPMSVASRVDVERIRSAYSSADWRALEDGKIITSEIREAGVGDSERSTAQATAIIRYPPTSVWTVLTDFESRPSYHSSTKEARIVQVEGNRVWVAEHLRFLLLNVRFRVIDTLEPELGSVSWVLDESVDHDIRGTTGSWQLTPLAQGHHTLVNYRTWFDTGQPVPGFIEHFLLNRSLPQLIGGLRTEVERRLGTK